MKLGKVLLFSAILCGCASPALPEPPTKLPEVRPGYVPGYLQPRDLPNGLALIPPPPAPGSPAFAADVEFADAMKKLRGTPRWDQAAKDDQLRFPQAAAHFSCALDIPISEEKTPHLYMMLRRIRMDASRATDKAKDKYQRPRPFMARGESMCVPEDQPHYRADSYPSGHASIGWAWALVLAELDPDRAGAILRRGIDFGTSRAVCDAHWKSDIEASRVIGAATVSRLHADPVFLAQAALARKEIEAAHRAGAHSPLDCAAEAR